MLKDSVIEKLLMEDCKSLKVPLHNKRDTRFDTARAICMLYIIAILHLSQYLGDTYYIYETFIGRVLTYSCLGLFTFMSGFLLGGKYKFTGSLFNSQVKKFYLKRILRFYPLFFIATIALWLIDFNSLKASLMGLIGAAPFVRESPKTLWYISMLMIFYLITPIINRKSLKYKIILSALFIGVFGLLKILSVLDVDTRFIYNLCFYCLGIILGSEIRIVKYSNKIMCLLIILYAVLLLALNYFSIINSYVVLILGGIGVFIIFGFSACIDSKSKIIRKVLNILSYSSMVLYLFHRLFYWCGETLCNPSEPMLKLAYLLCVVFPISVFISYWIQKGYDKLSQKNE